MPEWTQREWYYIRLHAQAIDVQAVELRDEMVADGWEKEEANKAVLGFDHDFVPPTLRVHHYREAYRIIGPRRR